MNPLGLSPESSDHPAWGTGVKKAIHSPVVRPKWLIKKRKERHTSSLPLPSFPLSFCLLVSSHPSFVNSPSFLSRPFRNLISPFNAAIIGVNSYWAHGLKPPPHFYDHGARIYDEPPPPLL